MMFEIDPRNSPLDDITRFMDNAAAQDRIVMNQHDIYRGTPDEDVFSDLFKNINVRSLVGQEVVGVGHVAQRFDMETAKDIGAGFMLPEDMPLVRVEGIYRELRMVSVVMGGILHRRVVHAIEQSREVTEDIYGDRSVNTFYDNLCASRASLYPKEPVNAHSMVALEGEELLGYFHRIMVEPDAEDFGFTERIKAIGQFVDERLALEGHQPNHINHQRISWLNAQKLIQGRLVTVQNFIKGKIGVGQDIRNGVFSEIDDEDVEIVAGDFTVAEGYRRDPVDGTPIFTGKKELYFFGKDGNEPVTVPVSKVLLVE